MGEKRVLKMKIMNYRQDNLIRLKLGLREAVVLTYLEQFIDSGRMKESTNFSNGEYRFFLIRYSKILRDLPILGVKTKRSLIEIFYKLEEANVLIRFKPLNNTKDQYIALNLKPLYEEINELPDFTIVGKDDKLKNYIKTECNEFSRIGFNTKFFRYKNSKMDYSLFNKIKIPKFNEELRKRLKILLSDLVYPYFKMISIDMFNQFEVRFLINSIYPITDLVLENNYELIERAIIDTYIDFYTEVKCIEENKKEK